MEDEERGDDFQRLFNHAGDDPSGESPTSPTHSYTRSPPTRHAGGPERSCDEETHVRALSAIFKCTRTCLTWHDRPDLTRDCIIWRCSDADEDKSMKETAEGKI